LTRLALVKRALVEPVQVAVRVDDGHTDAARPRRRPLERRLHVRFGWEPGRLRHDELAARTLESRAAGRVLEHDGVAVAPGCDVGLPAIHETVAGKSRRAQRNALDQLAAGSRELDHGPQGSHTLSLDLEAERRRPADTYLDPPQRLHGDGRRWRDRGPRDEDDADVVGVAARREERHGDREDRDDHAGDGGDQAPRPARPALDPVSRDAQAPPRVLAIVVHALPGGPRPRAAMCAARASLRTKNIIRRREPPCSFAQRRIRVTTGSTARRFALRRP
jgi:hypothetical protein